MERNRLRPERTGQSRVRTARPGSEVPAGDAKAVRVLFTANFAASGARTEDGVALVTGDYVLMIAQSVSAQRGVWKVNTAGAWKFVGQPKIVMILNGTAYGQTYYVLTAANTYSPGGAYFK